MKWKAYFSDTASTKQTVVAANNNNYDDAWCMMLAGGEPISFNCAYKMCVAFCFSQMLIHIVTGDIFMHVCGYERIWIISIFQKAKKKESKQLNRVGDRRWILDTKEKPSYKILNSWKAKKSSNANKVRKRHQYERWKKTGGEKWVI